MAKHRGLTLEQATELVPRWVAWRKEFEAIASVIRGAEGMTSDAGLAVGRAETAILSLQHELEAVSIPYYRELWDRTHEDASGEGEKGAQDG